MWDDELLRAEIAGEFDWADREATEVREVDSSLSQRKYVDIHDDEDRALLAAAQRARRARIWAAQPKAKLIRKCLDCGKAYTIQLPWRNSGRFPLYCVHCRTGRPQTKRSQENRTPRVPDHYSRPSRGELVPYWSK